MVERVLLKKKKIPYESNAILSYPSVKLDENGLHIT